MPGRYSNDDDPRNHSSIIRGNVYEPKFRARPRRNFGWCRAATTTTSIHIHIHAGRGGYANNSIGCEAWALATKARVGAVRGR